MHSRQYLFEAYRQYVRLNTGSPKKYETNKPISLLHTCTKLQINFGLELKDSVIFN